MVEVHRHSEHQGMGGIGSGPTESEVQHVYDEIGIRYNVNTGVYIL